MIQLVVQNGKKDRKADGNLDEEPLQRMRPMVETKWHGKCAKLNEPGAKACIDIDIDDDDSDSSRSSASEDNDWSGKQKSDVNYFTMHVHRHCIAS